MLRSLCKQSITLPRLPLTHATQVVRLSSACVLNNSGKDVLKEFKHIPLNEIKVNPSRTPATANKETTSTTTTPSPKINNNDKYSWITISLLALAGAGSLLYFKNVKEELKYIKEADQNRATVGGPFTLIDTNGQEFTEKQLLNKFSLLYFGFTHCPDICPAELDKITYWTNQVKKSLNVDIQPVFITCDPVRDDPKTLKSYLMDFSDNLVGLTGTHEQIKDVCKTYRVYFSTPENAKPTDDYIVDHSAYTYLIDPEGNFVQTFGSIYTEDEVLKMIENFIKTYVPKEEREKRLNKWYSFLFK